MEQTILKAANALLLSMTFMEAAAMDILDTIAEERAALREHFPDAVEDTAEPYEWPATKQSTQIKCLLASIDQVSRTAGEAVDLPSSLGMIGRKCGGGE